MNQGELWPNNDAGPIYWRCDQCDAVLRLDKHCAGRPLCVHWRHKIAADAAEFAEEHRMAERPELWRNRPRNSRQTPAMWTDL